MYLNEDEEEIERLENKNKKLSSEIKVYAKKNTVLRKKLREERSKKKPSNGELPAIGRKPKFTEEKKMIIKWMRSNGYTLRKLAQMFNCSVGLIHKVLNEDKKNNKKNNTITITITITITSDSNSNSNSNSNNKGVKYFKEI